MLMLNHASLQYSSNTMYARRRGGVSYTPPFSSSIFYVLESVYDLCTLSHLKAVEQLCMLLRGIGLRLPARYLKSVAHFQPQLSCTAGADRTGPRGCSSS